MNTLHIARFWAQVLLENEDFKQSCSLIVPNEEQKKPIFLSFFLFLVWHNINTGLTKF